MSGIFNYDTHSPQNRLSNSTGFRAYPDPFLTYTTMLMPRTIEETLRWCESFWFHNGTYARAMQRVVSYFLTKVQVTDASDEETEKYEEFLNDILNVTVVLSQAGADLMSYGNSFTSVYIPFKRFLYDDQAKIEWPIDDLNYSFDGKKFKWKCPRTGRDCSAKRPIDRRTTDETQIKIKRWSPHEIKIKWHPISGDMLYLWDPPKDIVKKIKSGDKFYLRHFPWEMVEAILAGKMFEFGPRVVYHMAEETLSGIKTGGWGLSQLVPNFSQAYYVQMAKMYNEVLMQEYIIPFRVISPAKGSTGAVDPLMHSNVGSFNSRVLNMVQKHQRTPGGWHALPFPVEYQALGGEGMEVTTYDHISMATDEMLNASGVPAELYKGTLQFQALPTALRLFQQTWPHLKAQFDGWLGWLMQTLATAFNWDKATAKLQDVTLADDIEKRSIVMQLMAGQRVSAETALAPLGIDADEELNKLMDERRNMQELEEEFTAEQQQRQMLQERFAGGGTAAMMPGGAMAAPGQGGPAQPAITPQDVEAQADQEAQRLLAMPYEQRRSEMHRIKKSNPTLHALVKQKMQDMRQEAGSVGQQQVIQQTLGGPQGQPPVM